MSKISCGFQKPADLVLFGPTLGVKIGFDPNFRPSSLGMGLLP